MSFLRRSIGIVLQNTILFYGTIAENIAYGEPQVSKREIIVAAKAAGAHDFIMRLPNAYDTVLGEVGIALSIGERQRLSVARVIFKNPKIIIFDEATSSVDVGTAEIIQNTIKKLAGTHTVFLITHHSSMLTKTDKIAVIEDGKLLRVGSYSEILESGWLKEVEMKRWRSYTYVA
jgi:ATP-binding cassette subfamily B protein